MKKKRVEGENECITGRRSTDLFNSTVKRIVLAVLPKSLVKCLCGPEIYNMQKTSLYPVA
jgi:hypothetical protein